MDLFHASGLKEHKSSFTSSINMLEKNITTLRENYESTWNELNTVRKSWASIQEDVIKIAKKYKYKFRKSLDKCSNEEIIEEIRNIMKLGEEDTLLSYISQLEIYYLEMESLAQKLEKYNKILSENHLTEEDKDEEYIIDLDEYRKIKQTKEQDEVISIYPASKTLINKVNSYFSVSEVKEVPFIEINDLLINDEKVENTFEENEEYVSYKIKGRLTLVDIAESVYGDKNYWYLLYSYKTNKDIIDGIAYKYDVDISTIAEIKGFLDGVELKFPLDIFVINDVHQNKVA